MTTTTPSSPSSALPSQPATLAAIRVALGADGVRAAILRALAQYPTVMEAAHALGTEPQHLRRAARRVGLDWTPRPGSPGSANGRRAKKDRAKAPAKKALRKNRQTK